MLSRRALALAALAALSIAASCSRREPATLAGSNVVLITIDTLRADHIGAYGYGPAATPNIDALARNGIRFDNAMAGAPLTLPSHATILTGMHPHRHGLRNNAAGSLPDDAATLPTSFAGAGYRTAAFVGAFVLDHRFGIGRGFETYDDEIDRDPDAPAGIEAERPATAVVDRALQWLGVADARPFFLWVHVYDPHAPYAPPEPYRSTFNARAYDGEIAYVDAEIGRLVAAIRGMPGGEKTVIAVMGDHGEALGEHGELTHGVLLYEPTLRVPLIVQAPGLAPRTVTTPVGLADVAPTLAALVALPKLARADGVDLSAALLGGREPEQHDLYAETQYPTLFGWSGLEALRRGALKLIDSPAPELYDLASDPREAKNVYTTERRSMFALRAALDGLRSNAVAAKPSAMDAETAQKLASLGYLGGAPQPVATNARAPLEVVHLFRRFEEATWALNEGRTEAAIEQFGSLVRDDPSNAVFRGSFAKSLRSAGRVRESLEVYRESVALRPDDADAWYNLAAAFQEAGEHARAAEAVREAIRRDSRRPEAHNVLGVALANEGNTADALTEFDKAIALDPRNAPAHNNRGNALRTLGRVDEAVTSYRRAIEISPAYADPWNGLGALEIERDRPRDAIALFSRAIVLAPADPSIRLNRAVAFQLSGDIAAALGDYRAFVSATGNDPAFEVQRRAAVSMIAKLSTAGD
ncbi:MAG: sulfatase-like hydrolase/transferase [Thermoanaerobaculia bacterium]